MPLPLSSGLDPLNSAAHLIQVALTPVFMLSGIGTLINVFNTRLSRVTDHLEEVRNKINAPKTDDTPVNVFDTPEQLNHQQVRLHRRIFVLDLAIILNGIGGASTCGAAMVLFVGSIRDASTSGWLLVFFGIALTCTVAALMFFLADTLLSWHGLRHDRDLSLNI
ncbi:DUF2721 domain-containing protein [Acetobacter thailandicus]|uniref:DUF2721 domain-containing protein n=1 Tax=Acetobacter thailandicus TaxID=1502842 RepID=A0ABT3QCK9_9PROT|nr:DUF2721 domain-containing protein [Acetobacter thailandicus]MCX2563023.1 DUF2721 domain-containing protein [Acetobacter thailandicus]NHN96157.1 DUF2721 domain-containing protein [Acetobacter thailandicus]